MYDYPNSILETKELLEKHGIGTFGLMDNGTIVPYEYTDELGKSMLFSVIAGESIHRLILIRRIKSE